jgi:hypothetical protein
MLLDARASFLNTFVLKAGDTMTGDLTFSGAFHPVIAPGSDTDADLLTVDVTGTPTLGWDESEDSFSCSHGLRIAVDGVVTIGAATSPAADVLLYSYLASGITKLRIESDGTTQYHGAEVQMISNPSTTDEAGVRFGHQITDAGGANGKFYMQRINKAGAFVENLMYYDMTSDYWDFFTGGTRALRITSDQDFHMSGISPSAKLHVDQSSTTGAKPVLLLDQADIDLEFIKFVGSSEDSQADRSLVDAADMTTPGALTGWIQVYVEDIQGTNPITDGVYYIPFYAAPSA